MIMSIKDYTINHRPLTTYAPLTNELSLNPNKNHLFDLSYLTGINVEGEKALEFLQGQLSCDVKDVSPHQFRQGALCNLKGRVLALVDVVNWHEQGIKLILPQDLLEATLLTLSKTAVLSRVKLKPTTDYQLFGFYMQNPADLIPFNLNLLNTEYGVMHQDTCCVYHLGNGVYMFMVKNELADGLIDEFNKHSQWRGSLAWHALQFQQKRIEIYPESRGLFLPHRIDLHRSGYLNFNKGCYKGQEIIARTHYRATLKHELQFFMIQTNEPLQSGQRLLEPHAQKEVGELIDYCPLGDQAFMIAVSILFQPPQTLRIEGHKDIVTLKVPSLEESH